MLQLKDYFLLDSDGILGLFDVNSLRLFEVDKNTYHMLREFQYEQDIGHLTKKLDLSEHSIYNRLEQVEKILKSETKNRPKKIDEMIRIVLHLSNSCNLACKYCYAGGGNYGIKEELLNSKMMEQIVEFLANWGRKYVIQFFGGEPLLNYKVMKSFLSLVPEYFKDSALPQYSIVTNGTIMNDEIRELLNTYNITTVVSLDGPKEVNDKHRVTKNGKGVYDRVIQTIKELNKDRIFGLSLEATYTAEHLNNSISVSDLLDFAFNLGLDGIHVAPAGYPYMWADKDFMSMAESFAEAVNHSFDLLIKSRGKFFFSLTQKYLLPFYSKIPNNLYCTAGTNTIAISTDGTIYPCYSFVGKKDFMITHVNNNDVYDVLNNTIEQNRRKYLKKGQCKDCWARTTCVSCMYNNYFATKDPLNPDPRQCALEKYVLEKFLKKVLVLQKNPQLWRNILLAASGRLSI